MNIGSCRFGLWRVEVDFSQNIIYRVRFCKTAPKGPIPPQFTCYLAGLSADFTPLLPAVLTDTESIYTDIYRAVRKIPYGETKTYGQIAKECSTHARVVGNALANNPTPLLIPCHRVVAAIGPGGFSPDPELKLALLDLEKKHRTALQQRTIKTTGDLS